MIHFLKNKNKNKTSCDYFCQHKIPLFQTFLRVYVSENIDLKITYINRI